MAEPPESLAWHVTAGVTRGTRNRDTKVGPALSAPGQPFLRGAVAGSGAVAYVRNDVCDPGKNPARLANRTSA
jgi:hypothetical protein